MIVSKMIKLCTKMDSDLGYVLLCGLKSVFGVEKVSQLSVANSLN